MHKRAVRKICALLIYNAETVQTLKQWKKKKLANFHLLQWRFDSERRKPLSLKSL